MTHARLPSLFDNIFVGVDRTFDTLRQLETLSSGTYPPYNIVSENDNYVIELAVAGYARDDLDIEFDPTKRSLVIKGEMKEKEDRTFLHRGIASRNFVRGFALADHLEVESVNLQDGLLQVNLVKNIPEDRMPRKLAIS